MNFSIIDGIKVANRTSLSDHAKNMLAEAGGIPEAFRDKITIEKSSTGDEHNQNFVMHFSYEGEYFGFILGWFAGSSQTSTRPVVFMTVNPEWKAVKTLFKDKYIFGKKLEMYDDAIQFKTISDMIQCYVDNREKIKNWNKAIDETNDADTLFKTR